MADPVHRLAVQKATAAAVAGEAGRREAMGPAGDGECGVQLATATPEQLASLGMSSAAQVPAEEAAGPPFPPLLVQVEEAGDG